MMHHHLDKSITYSQWDNSIAPRLEIESGDSVLIEMNDASDGQVAPGMSAAAFAQIEFEKIHALTGPIAVRNAKAGDTLKIEILEYFHKGWAWTSINPDLCFLPDDFDDFYLHHWVLEGDITHSMPGVTLALHPFCGIIGVQRAEMGSFRTRPPGNYGGNMDVKHLSAGSTLYLPVLVDAAGLCSGDCHAAQGDGEVSINGLEAPMDVKLRISIAEDVSVEAPYLQTTPHLVPPAYAGKPYHAFISSGPDLMENARGAVRRKYLLQAKSPEEVIEKLEIVANEGIPDVGRSRTKSGAHSSFETPIPDSVIANVCVFCSVSIEDPDYLNDGYLLGKELAEKNYGCISGAGTTGVMGTVVQGSIEAGGWTGGSNVPHIIEIEGLPEGLSSFWLRPDIYTRMEVMIQKSDAFAIFPGGAGTVQEMLALLIFKQSGNDLMRGKPIVLFNRLNPDGETRFWDRLIDLLAPWHADSLFEVVNERDDILPQIAQSLKSRNEAAELARERSGSRT